MYFKPSRKNKDFVFLPVSILTSKEIIPASLFSFPLRIRDPKKRFHENYYGMVPSKIDGSDVRQLAMCSLIYMNVLSIMSFSET